MICSEQLSLLIPFYVMDAKIVKLGFRILVTMDWEVKYSVF